MNTQLEKLVLNPTERHVTYLVLFVYSLTFKCCNFIILESDVCFINIITAFWLLHKIVMIELEK